MNTKRILSIVVIVLVAVFLLAACSRSASKAPAAKVTSTKGNFPSLGKTQTVSQPDAIKTQTAIAKANLNPILGEVTATPAAPLATETPQSPAKPTAKQPAAKATDTPVQPPATSAPVVGNIPTITPGLPATYTLQKGEFLYCIARRFNVNPTSMMSLNGLGPNSLVYEGMVLKIPQGGGKFPDGRALKTHPAQYTVVSGDTIYSIACKFGDVEPWAIAMANNLAAPYTLTAGAVINIP
jgi:LysM repeat protein